MKIRLNVFFVFFMGCFFAINSCQSSNPLTYEQKLNEYGVDSIISFEEWNNLIDYINSNKNNNVYSRFSTDEILDEEKLKFDLERRGFTVQPFVNKISKKVNIYIENSGSMFGFVNGNTAFKNVLTKLVIDLKSNGYLEEYIQFHFINNIITPQSFNGELEYYPKSLMNIRDKDSEFSDINHIYNLVLKNTDMNTISILVSDCVYSVRNEYRENNLDGALNIQKSLTEGVFKTFIKEHTFPAILAQFISDFHGTFYTKDDVKIFLQGQKIPYYVTVIGEESELFKFDFIDKLEGFQNKLILSTKDYSHDTYYSLLPTSVDNAEYQPTRTKNSNSNIIQSIEKIRFRGKSYDNFVFSLVVDFSNFPVSDNYLVDINNYIINSGDYDLLFVQPFDKKIIKTNDLKKLEQFDYKPTHVIVFQSRANNYNDLDFSLTKNIPEWVYEWNTNDDTNIRTKPNQTFGLKYFVEGIFEAYKSTSNNNNYINFNIKIKK